MIIESIVGVVIQCIPTATVRRQMQSGYFLPSAKATQRSISHTREMLQVATGLKYNLPLEFNLSVVETQSETQKGASGQSFK